jgi:hypothetical protein
MREFILSGWNVGFDKVGLTNLLRHDLGFPLAQAKGITDSVLENQLVTLEVPDSQLSWLSSKLNDIGARFVMEEDADGKASYQ